MTNKQVFSFKDFEEILTNAIEVINGSYSDKMDMRDVSLLSWYSMLVSNAIKVEYDKRTGDVE